MKTEQSTLRKYVPVIGLEVHVQLLTQSKIFCSDSALYGSPPNTHAGVVTMAHPGTLPRLNKRVVEHAIKMGIACNCTISRLTTFDRKNYFYPDLPKGYQITQDRTPICKGGDVTIRLRNQTEKRIKLNRIHIEEDAGKSIHVSGESYTLIDLNRAGTPLIEIVSEPVIETSEEASAFLAEIRRIVRYLDICDGNMEEGSIRCDANVSVMLKGATQFGKKVEIKNMNSISNVQHAVECEILRQITELENRNTILSESRTFDPSTGKTYSMRTKEELNDYRYFPDPDLSPVEISEEWFAQIKATMPMLPDMLQAKFIEDYKLPRYDAQVLTESKEIARFFEDVCKKTKNHKAASNWVMGPIKTYLNESDTQIENLSITAGTIAELIGLVDTGKLSFTIASQKVFYELLKSPEKTAIQIAQELNLIQDRNHDVILPIIEEVIKGFPLKVEEYKKGKKGIASMFMGEIMKRSKGKADPQVANELLIKKLTEL